MTYPMDFLELWASYPKRPGNNKRAAYKAYCARLDEGESHADMLAGVLAYRKYVAARGELGTNWVKMAQTFLGPMCHHESDWTFVGDEQSLDNLFAPRSKDIH